MHYLPFGTRLNKGILMVTQLMQANSFCHPNADAFRYRQKGSLLKTIPRIIFYASDPLRVQIPFYS